MRANDSLPKHAGFTITELVVVISLTTILLATLLPAMSAVRNMVDETSGISKIASAVQTSRAYATVPKPDRSDTGNPIMASHSFSGAAILFAPANELRLVENDQLALNGASNYLESSNRNGYRDIPGLDYISLPADIGVVGIARGNDGLYLLTPPFAIRFNQHGHLIAGVSTDSNRVVCYDGDYDDMFVIGSDRTNGYNVDPWDPSSPTYNKTNAWDSTEEKYKLPFEVIESVVGVAVYSKKELRDAGLNHVGDSSSRSINTIAKNWILDKKNGTLMLFSRYTGERIGG